MKANWDRRREYFLSLMLRFETSARRLRNERHVLSGSHGRERIRKKAIRKRDVYVGKNQHLDVCVPIGDGDSEEISEP